MSRTTPQRKTSTTSDASATETCIPLIDPMSVGGILEIPLSKTFDTKGRADWLKGTLKKDLSLCCLFQKNRCFAAEKCHQVHVEQQFMHSIRAQQRNIISCCRHCNDTASLSQQGIIFFASAFHEVQRLVIDQSNSGSFVDPSRVAYTTGLVQLMQSVKPVNGTLTIPMRSICRLHLRRSCKYARDCKNIHVCSGLGISLGAPSSRTSEDMPRQTSSSCVAPQKMPPTRVQPKREPEVHRPSMQAPKGLAPKPTPSFGIFDRVIDPATQPPKAPQVAHARAPMPLHPIFERPPECPAPADAHEQSSNELSVKLTGLCFNPMLLSQPSEANEHRPCALGFGMDMDGECALSSASSSRSTQKYYTLF